MSVGLRGGREWERLVADRGNNLHLIRYSGIVSVVSTLFAVGMRRSRQIYVQPQEAYISAGEVRNVDGSSRGTARSVLM